jgi:hypothetical protein
MLNKLAQEETPIEWVKSSSYSLVNERETAIYNMGKEKGVEEEKERFDSLIKENFQRSYNDTTQVLDKIKTSGIEVISARLKIKSINCLRVAVSLKKDNLSDDIIEDIYNFIYELETISNKEDYNIDFSLIKANEGFSDKSVENDGYIYKHQLVNEKSSRTA